MTPTERGDAFQVFRRAESLASSMGTQVLIEASRDKGGDVAAKLAADEHAHDRAFWMCLEYPDVIDGARTLARIESLPKRMWKSRQGLPGASA